MKKIKIFALVLAIVMCIALLASCSKPVIAMEYKGENITMNMYSYWLSQIKSQYVSEANDTDEYWATKYSNGETYEQKMREIVDFNVKVNLVCMHLFNELGLKVSESEANELKTGLSDLLKSYGSASELNSFLSQYNINYNKNNPTNCKKGNSTSTNTIGIGNHIRRKTFGFHIERWLELG